MEVLEALTVPSDFKSLRLVRSYIQNAAEAAGLDTRAAYRLTLAIEELTSNIIEHGSHECKDRPIKVAATRTEQQLTVAVEDEGHPYDISAAAMPDVTLPLEERRRGGLGNFLILKNVDEFRYERVDNLNRNTLIVKMPANTIREQTNYEV